MYLFAFIFTSVCFICFLLFFLLLLLVFFNSIYWFISFRLFHCFYLILLIIDRLLIFSLTVYCILWLLFLLIFMYYCLILIKFLLLLNVPPRAGFWAGVGVGPGVEGVAGEEDDNKEVEDDDVSGETCSRGLNLWSCNTYTPLWFVLRLSTCFLYNTCQNSLQMNLMISKVSWNRWCSIVYLPHINDHNKWSDLWFIKAVKKRENKNKNEEKWNEME